MNPTFLLPRADFPRHMTVKEAMRRLAERGMRLELSRAGLVIRLLH